MEVKLISYITTKEEVNKIVSERGQIGLGRFLADLDFDLSKPMKVDVKNGNFEFWQPEDDILITPSMPVINGSQRKRFIKNRQATLLKSR